MYWWIIGFGLVVSVFLAVFAYVELWLTATLVILSAILVVVGLLGFTLHIKVTQDELIVGSHVLEAAYIGGAEIVEGDVRAATDAESFMLTRPYAKQKVRVAINDAADPHPAWLVSTKHPQALVAAIRRLGDA